MEFQQFYSGKPLDGYHRVGAVKKLKKSSQVYIFNHFQEVLLCENDKISNPRDGDKQKKEDQITLGLVIQRTKCPLFHC